MFKLVVLSALVAAASAKPSGALLPTEILGSSLLLPGALPSKELFYSAPWEYLKGSDPYYYAAPYSYYGYSSYPYASSPVIAKSPFFAAAPLSYPALHFIKKRKAPAHTEEAAPLQTVRAPTQTTPVLTHVDSGIRRHKRSALELLPYSYLAPTAYSHQSRIDIKQTPAITTTYSAPLTYASPYIYSHFY